ncbi:MAG: trehalose-phosphatase [Burkholderiaceae bacterium]
MTPLFSREGRSRLQHLAQAETLYAFDFDGTLAPIVADPAQARAAERVTLPLAQLASLVPVAVVSGRAQRDLIERLPCEIAYLVGNHGNEGLPDAGDSSRLTETCRAWRSALELQLLAPEGAGVRLEDKGHSLSLHYRTSPDAVAASAFLRTLAHALTPQPTVIDGKMVLNLLPPGSLTKFEALQILMEHEGVDNVLFVGDDETDEIVFERAPEHWMTVRIDPGSGSAARYCLDEQASIEILLAHLLAEHADRARADLQSGA